MGPHNKANAADSNSSLLRNFTVAAADPQGRCAAKRRPLVPLHVAFAMFAALSSAGIAEVSNGEFDSNVFGWTCGATTLDCEWSPEDSGNEPSSGSLQISLNNISPFNPRNGGSASQCIELPGPGIYNAHMMVKEPEGVDQSTVEARIVLVEYEDSRCRGPSSSDESVVNVATMVGEDWSELGDVVYVRSPYATIRVGGGGDLRALSLLIDSIRLEPVEATIPTLGTTGIALLCLAVAGLGVWKLRSEPHNKADERGHQHVVASLLRVAAGYRQLR